MKLLKQGATLFLMMLSLLCSAWYYVTNVPKIKIDKRQLRNTNDSIITGLSMKQFSLTGVIANTMQTPIIRHVPNQDTYYIQAPIITITQNNQPAWKITSAEAKAIHGGKKIIFQKSVHIHQDKGTRNEESTFITEQITYFPKTKIAITSQDILFKQPGSEVQAKGMRANLEKKQVQLLENARGFYAQKKG